MQQCVKKKILDVDLQKRLYQAINKTNNNIANNIVVVIAII